MTSTSDGAAEPGLYGIAVIGLAGRFPGAPTIRALWRNLCNGVESVDRFSDAELEDAFSPAERASPAFVKARPVLPDVDLFDAGFFGMQAREAALTDPQHRVFLEIAWEALEDAGYDSWAYPGAVGVFAGCSMNTYFLRHVCADRGAVETFASAYQVGQYPTLVGALSDTLATRVSYKFNLRGPSMTVQTACSTSLVAVAQACQALLLHQCDMALAGGVSITFPQRRGYLAQEGGMVSPDGVCRPFDAAANGTVFGSGAGVVLLKRLADALADGDQVYAVIRGVAVNNDGAAKAGFTTPSVDAQAAVVATAQALAGVDARSIGYVECHGTATPLGDPIEVAALTQAFRISTDALNFCAIGSAKGNFGHLDAAAGVAGLIKAVLAVKHGVLPPTLHFRAPNPRLQLEASPFFVQHRLGPWPAMSGPRRAGVSALGVGGTNVHVVLEEAPAEARPSLRAAGRSPEVLVLSARSPEALNEARANLAARLRADGPEELALTDAACTLQTGRRAFEHRCAVVAHTKAEAAALLDPAVAAPSPAGGPRPVLGSVRKGAKPPSVVFMFPGQGAQYSRMGAQLYQEEAVYRAELDRCAALLRPMLGLDLRNILLRGSGNKPEDADALRCTTLAQPALFAVEYALARQWLSWGVRPAAMIGHSVGEFVAACLAGVMPLEDALTLVATRGRLMDALPGGAMLAVRLPEAELRPILLDTGAELAAVNAARLCVAAGSHDAIAALERTLESRGAMHRRLHTSHAFHSAMMEPVLGELARTVGRLTLAPPNIPYVSCVTGRWITPAEALSPDYWARHCREPVRFADGLATILGDRGPLADAGATTSPLLLEVGPGAALATLARQGAAGSAGCAVVTSLPDATGQPGDGVSAADAVARLWVAGVQVDWATLRGDAEGRRVSLPTYPFQRTRHWIDAAPIAATAVAPQPNAVADAAATTAPLQPPKATVIRTRESGIRQVVIATLEDLSGEPLDAAALDASFLELGFDSLFLSQVAQKLQEKFRVRIGFRQLMGDLATIDALADFIAEHMPAALASATEASAAKPSLPAPQPLVAAASAALATAAAPSGPGVIEGLMQTQLQAMSQLMTAQLEALRSLNAGAPTVPQAAPATPPAAPPAAPPAVAAPEPAREMTNRFRRFSSPAPKAAAGGSGLTADQRGMVDALVSRLTQRTPTSKRLTQERRAVLADPRAAAGFWRDWKEIVYPIVSDRASGSRLWDVDGNEYIDLVNGYGATAFGHGPDFVLKAVEEQLRQGFAIGPQSSLAGEVAAMLSDMTGHERVSFTCTGSEAVMAAMRVARAVTGRKRVVAFAGAYHGGFEEVLVRGVRVGGEPRGLPAAMGITEEAVANLTVLENAEPISLDWIRTHAHELAAVLVEPVQSRHPDLQPGEFLRELRAITEASGTALIFDEVVTGFRLHPGGAQALFGVRADLATYGKVLGGGLPIGILAGTPRFMDALDGGQWRYGDNSAPEADVTVFAGTFVRHPLALAAARAVLRHLKTAGPALQEELGARTGRLTAHLNDVLAQRGIGSRVERCGSIFYFNPAAEDRRAGLLFHLLRDRGIHAQENFPCFLTTAHSDADLEAVVAAFEWALDELQSVGILLSEGRAVARGEASSGKSAAEAPDAPDTPPAEAPLTEPQMEIWLSAQLGDHASCAFNESVSVELRGQVDHAALSAALDTVASRHDALRARFTPAEGTMAFERSGHGWPALSDDDLSVLQPAERDVAFAAILNEEAYTPFDLVAGPPARARLVQRAVDDHVLVLTAHHIVCDGWSINVIVSELAALYAAMAGKGTAGSVTLAPAPSFARHATAERAAAASAVAAIDDESWWIAQYEKGVPAPLELPSNYLRPSTKTFRGGTVRWAIDADLARSIRKVAARRGCTSFAALLASFQALVGRLGGQQDVAVAVPMAGQSLLDDSQKGLVGHCVNFLPVRAIWDNQTTLAEHVIAVHKAVLDAREHQRCTLGTIVRRLALPRTPNRLPLADVQFNLERVGAPTEFGGLRASVSANDKAFVNYDLFLNVVESDQGLALECDYSTDLFDAATVLRWLGHYRTLLEAFVNNPDQLVVAAPLLTEAERQALLVDGSSAVTTAARRLPFHEMFEIQARKTPDAIAAECGEHRWTYQALDQRAETVARHLRARVTAPDARVGVLMERSLEMLAALLAVAKAGFAYVPLDPHHPPARLSLIIEQSELAVLLTDGASRLPLSVPAIDLSRPLPPVEVRRPENLAVQQSRFDGDSIAYVIFTSGSTGIPKGVAVGHQALANLLVSMADEPGFSASDALLAVTTISFDIAALELFLPLTVGGRVVIASRDAALDGFAVLDLLRGSGATMLQATPATWRMLLEAGFEPSGRLKMLCGGEALPRDLADRLSGGGGTPWNMYGPTETTIWSACGKVGANGGPIIIGSPIANTRLYVLDAQSQLTPVGVAGELHVGGDGLAEGYFNDPEQTAAKFVPDPFATQANARMYRTGDLARWLPDGGLQVVGRIDDQIKLRGFRIELGDVEAALRNIPGIGQAAAMLRKGASGAPLLVAYHVDKDGRQTEPDVLRATLAAVLPDYMVPAAFVRLDTLPLTPNGKLDRRALPAPTDSNQLQRAATRQPARPLEGSLQVQLGAIWQEVLGVALINADDDLLALGADSLHMFQIIARTRRSGIALSTKDLLIHRTIGAIETALAQADTSEVAKVASAGVSSLPRLSDFRRKGRGP